MRHLDLGWQLKEWQTAIVASVVKLCIIDCVSDALLLVGDSGDGLPKATRSTLIFASRQNLTELAEVSRAVDRFQEHVLNLRPVLIIYSIAESRLSTVLKVEDAIVLQELLTRKTLGRVDC